MEAGQSPINSRLRKREKINLSLLTLTSSGCGP